MTERGESLSAEEYRDALMRQAMEAEQEALRQAEQAAVPDGQLPPVAGQAPYHMHVPPYDTREPSQAPPGRQGPPMPEFNLPEFSQRDAIYLAGGLVVGGLVVVYLLNRAGHAGVPGTSGGASGGASES